tara:strand:+ start:15756 stop:16151 length:396 start_codon:yes stop_codon:yes gene_type:complete
MAVFNYSSPGLGNVGSYQVSGRPFASSSLDARVGPEGTSFKLRFPSVTRWVILKNSDPSSNALSCSFSDNGLGVLTNNYFTVDKDITSPRLELKVSELYFTGSSDFEVVAGLTMIGTGSLFNNWSGSSGVG